MKANRIDRAINVNSRSAQTSQTALASYCTSVQIVQDSYSAEGVRHRY